MQKPKQMPGSGEQRSKYPGTQSRPEPETIHAEPEASAHRSDSDPAKEQTGQNTPDVPNAPRAAPPMAVSGSSSTPIRPPRRSVREWIRNQWLLDEELPENEYYLRIATRYRLLKYAAILLTLALLLGMMAVYSEDITVENFRYLLRDLDRDQSKENGIYEVIRYDSGSDLQFAMYKGDLVVLRSGQTAIYGTDARTVMNESNGFYAPILLSADKYFLAYDPGQTTSTLTLYNAFSSLHTMRLERPIYGAALSDSGMYAVVSDETGYRGVVSLYDADFDLVTKIMKDKYIWDIAFSPDGSRLAVLSAYEKEGEWWSEIHVVDARSGETFLQTVLKDTLGYACSFTAEGALAVMSGKGMRILWENGDERNCAFDGEVPVGWCFGESCQAVYFNRTILGQEKIVRILKDGGEIGRFSLDGQVLDTCFVGEVLYLLTETHLYRMDPRSGEIQASKVGDHCLRLVLADENHLLLCYRSQAVAIDPNTYFEEGKAMTTEDEAADPAIASACSSVPADSVAGACTIPT